MFTNRTYTNQRSQDLMTYSWCATDTEHPRGVYFLHGLGEHAGRYNELAQWFVQRGWAVASHDHIGHGRSSGQRGAIPVETAYLEDAEALISQFSKQFSTPPLLLGHSMGGLVATRIAQRQNVALSGLVLSAPPYTVPLTMVQQFLMRVVGAVYPNLSLGNGLNAQKLSHDKDVCQAYQKDPLVHDRVSPALVSFLVKHSQQALEEVHLLPNPSLLLVAGADALVDVSATADFIKKADTQRLTSHWYEGCYHEIFNETSSFREQALQDLDRWLQNFMA